MSTEDASTTSGFMSWVKQHQLLVGILAAGLVVLFILWYFLGYAVDQRNEGERQEQFLAGLYNRSVTTLSTCLDQGQIAAQVTEAEYKSIKEILVETAAARYTDASGNPTDASAVIGGGRMISALQESYPQVDQRSWQNLQTVVVGCRESFKNAQDAIQAAAVDYNSWRVSNSVFNGWIKGSFPSNELKINIASGETLYAMSAYDRIVRVVAVDQAIQAFETGTLDEQNLFDK